MGSSPTESTIELQNKLQLTRRLLQLNRRWFFWSLAVYDNQTRSELQTDQQFPSIGSQKKGIVVNPDNSVDVYFAPTVPAGHEDNWLQTIPR
jgi:hypothetical protein